MSLMESAVCRCVGLSFRHIFIIRNNGVLPTNIEYRSQLPTACDIQRCRAANGQTN